MQAKVSAKFLPISTKHTIELCNFIRSKNLQKARRQLELVLEKKVAVPLKRFNKDRGHRKGKIAAGFYPQKATKEIIILLNSLESNALNIGMNTNTLFIAKAIANKAGTPWHYGRHRGITMKRTHIELVAEEQSKASKPRNEQ